MNLILKTLFGMAALVVIANGALGLYDRHQLQQQQKKWRVEVEQAGNIEGENLDGIPISDSGELEAWIPAYAEVITGMSGENNAALIPVFFGLSGQNKTLELGVGRFGQLEFLGICSMSPMVNVIYTDLDAGITKTIYDERVFLPTIGKAPISSGIQAVFFVVREDSNEDGRLSCADWAELEFYNPQSDGIFKTGIHFNANKTSLRLANNDLIYAAFDVPAAGKNTTVKVYEINIDDQSVVELEIPNLIEDARKAFESAKNE